MINERFCSSAMVISPPMDGAVREKCQLVDALLSRVCVQHIGYLDPADENILGQLKYLQYLLRYGRIDIFLPLPPPIRLRIHRLRCRQYPGLPHNRK